MGSSVRIHIHGHKTYTTGKLEDPGDDSEILGALMSMRVRWLEVRVEGTTTDQAKTAIWRILAALPDLVVFVIRGNGLGGLCDTVPFTASIRAVKWGSPIEGPGDVALFSAVTEVATHLRWHIDASKYIDLTVAAGMPKSPSIRYLHVTAEDQSTGDPDGLGLVHRVMRFGSPVNPKQAAECVDSFPEVRTLVPARALYFPSPVYIRYMKPMPTVTCVVGGYKIDEDVRGVVFPAYAGVEDGGEVPPPVHFSPATINLWCKLFERAPDACADDDAAGDDEKGWYSDLGGLGAVLGRHCVMGYVAAAYLLGVARGCGPMVSDDDAVAVLRHLTNVRDGIRSAETVVQSSGLHDTDYRPDGDFYFPDSRN
jgi:hypothetical protein